MNRILYDFGGTKSNHYFDNFNQSFVLLDFDRIDRGWQTVKNNSVDFMANVIICPIYENQFLIMGESISIYSRDSRGGERIFVRNKVNNPRLVSRKRRGT